MADTARRHDTRTIVTTWHNPVAMYKARHNPVTPHSAAPARHDTTTSGTQQRGARQDKARPRPGTTWHNVARHKDTAARQRERVALNTVQGGTQTT